MVVEKAQQHSSALGLVLRVVCLSAVLASLFGIGASAGDDKTLSVAPPKLVVLAISSSNPLRRYCRRLGEDFAIRVANTGGSATGPRTYELTVYQAQTVKAHKRGTIPPLKAGARRTQPVDLPSGLGAGFQFVLSVSPSFITVGDCGNTTVN